MGLMLHESHLQPPPPHHQHVRIVSEKVHPVSLKVLSQSTYCHTQHFVTFWISQSTVDLNSISSPWRLTHAHGDSIVSNMLYLITNSLQGMTLEPLHVVKGHPDERPPSIKTTFSATTLFMFPCKQTSHQGPSIFKTAFAWFVFGLGWSWK